MELTLREAATILGVTPRAVRARIARGSLHGFKRGGRWVVPRSSLDGDPEQRRRLRAVSDDVRATVEKALPDRDARSVAELKPFRETVAVLTRVQDAPAPAPRAVDALHEALGLLAEGHHQFHRDTKVAAFAAARGRLCHALAALLLTPTDPPARHAAEAIERQVLPPRAGLIRWAEGLP